jgi:HEAT repeat protein
LIKFLEDKNPANRAEAARALGELGPDAADAVPSLATRLADQDDGVRANTAAALSSIGSGAKQAVPALLKALNDKDKNVRTNAVGALISVKPTGKDAVQALMSKMKDRDGWATVYAPKALGVMGPAAKDAIPMLTEAVEKWGSYCREPAWALGQMGPDAKASLPTLRKRLNELKLRLQRNDLDQFDRQEAAHDLIEVASATWKLDRQSDMIKELMDIVEDRAYRGRLSHVRDAAAKALGEIGAPGKDAVPVLIASLKENDYFAEQSAAEALGNMGSAAEAAVPALVKLLEPDHHPRQDVIIALGRIGPPAKSTLPDLEKSLASFDSRESLVAAEAIWRIDKRVDSTVPVLIASLKLKEMPTIGVNSLFFSIVKPAIEIRRHAAQVLGEIGPKAKAAIPALREALKDERLTVRQAAAEALKKIDTNSD